MARRVSSSQLQSMLRQAAQKQQRAINDYNRGVRQHNAEVVRRQRNLRQAIDQYNREVRAHNARVGENRRRLRAALTRLSTQRIAVTSVSYYRAVVAVHEQYDAVEQAAAGTWLASRDDLLDLAQQEAANSIALARSAEHPPDGDPVGHLDPEVEGKLTEFSSDLASRWRGALFALNPRNPDAARHFSTSSREMLNGIIEEEAPDDLVLAANPQAPRTADGRPTRRARLAYCLVRAGRASDSLAAFADADVAEIVELFQVFNDGTHGSAGIFDVRHLNLIRRRVEGAVTFLHSILRT